MAFSSTERFIQNLDCVWKYSTSFFKKEWKLEDYPIRWRMQDMEHYGPERLRPKPWVASICNWWLSGTGDTKEEAIESLRQSLQRAKATLLAEGKRIHRPGARVPIVFAPQQAIEQAPTTLYDDFVKRVLDLEWAWMSDESTLWDFSTEETNDAYYEKIRSIYGVDVSDVPNANIAGILARLAANDAKPTAAAPESQ